MPNRRDREDKQETTLFISEMVWKQPHCTERNLRRRIRRSIKCPKEAAKEDTEDKYVCLERHELPTLEKKVIRFMPNRRDREDKQETTLFISEMIWKTQKINL